MCLPVIVLPPHFRFESDKWTLNCEKDTAGIPFLGSSYPEREKNTQTRLRTKRQNVLYAANTIRACMKFIHSRFGWKFVSLLIFAVVIWPNSKTNSAHNISWLRDCYLFDMWWCERVFYFYFFSFFAIAECMIVHIVHMIRATHDSQCYSLPLLHYIYFPLPIFASFATTKCFDVLLCGRRCCCFFHSWIHKHVQCKVHRETPSIAFRNGCLKMHTIKTMQCKIYINPIESTYIHSFWHGGVRATGSFHEIR